MRRRLLASLLLVVVVVALAIGAGRSRRFVDLTAEQTLTLTAETRDVAAAVDRPVEITAFLRRDEPGRVEAATLLERYRRLNRRISGEVVDPDDSPGELARLGVDPVFGGVAVQAGDEIEVAPSATEQDLTAALARIVRGEAPTVCVATGHGELALDGQGGDGFSGAAAVLEREGNTLLPIDLLASPQVPDVCVAVVVAGPRAPLGDALDALGEWTAEDGRLLVLSDPESTVDLNPLLSPYGLGVRRGVVFEGDPEAVVAGDVTSPIVRTYSSGSPVVRRLPPTYFPGVQEVTVDASVEESVPGLTVTRLADTSPLSYLETEPLEAAFDPELDGAGPVTVAAAADRSSNEGGAIRRTRVLVVGDADFAANAFLGEAGNAQLLRSAVRWLTLDESLVALSANLPSDRPLRLTDARVAYARFLTVVVVPALFLLAGGLVWALRRSR